MFKPPEKFFFDSHLVVIYKWFYYCGFVHFKYDKRARQFRQTLPQYIVSTLLHVSLVIGSLMQFARHVVGSIAYSADAVKKSIDAQDETIIIIAIQVSIISMFIVSVNCLRYRAILMSALNEMLNIFNQIKRWSNSKSYLPVSFQTIIVMKVCVAVYRFVLETSKCLMIVILLGNIALPYGLLLVELVALSHVYSQMTLISFYDKMNDILRYYICTTRRTNDCTKCVRDMLVLSFRIHHVKRNLNAYFAAVHITTYLNVIKDITQMYEFLKITIYAKYHPKVLSENDLYWRIFNFVPINISVFFDMFVIGHMSDALVEAELLFQKNVMKLLSHGKLSSSKILERKIDMMLIQNQVYDMNTVTLDRIRLDRHFAFDFLINIIVVYVISFLQYYASETIYSAQGSANVNTYTPPFQN